MIRQAFLEVFGISISLSLVLMVIVFFFRKAEQEVTVWIWKAVCFIVLLRLIFVTSVFGGLIHFDMQSLKDENLSNVVTNSEIQDLTNTAVTDVEKETNKSTLVEDKEENVEKAPLSVSSLEQKTYTATKWRFSWNSTQIQMTVLNIVSGIWFVICILHLLYMFLGYIYFRRQVCRWRYKQIPKYLLEARDLILSEYGIQSSVEVYYSNQIQSPMIIGLIHPIILLPRLDYSKADAEFILRHELMHLKKKDILLKFTIYLAKSIHWFNPIVRLFCQKVNDYIEVCCDYYVVEKKDFKYRKTYSLSIVKLMEENIGEKKRQIVLSTSFNESKEVIFNRVSNILNETPRKRKQFKMICLILVIVMAGSLVVCTDTSIIAFSKDLQEQQGKVEEVKPADEQLEAEETNDMVDDTYMNTWYLKTKLVNQDSHVRALQDADNEAIGEIQNEMFSKLTEEDIAYIKNELSLIHQQLEKLIVQDDLGTEYDAQSIKWDLFICESQDGSYNGEEMINALNILKNMIDYSDIDDLLEQAVTALQRVQNLHDASSLMEAHGILHDLDYWFIQYLDTDYQYQPGDWDAVQLYYGTLDSAIEKIKKTAER
jgi:beta-lactamase regulating signal transducer with metallopeptidase domain